MKNRVNLRALKINGHDPRLSKSFLLLSSELSHLSGNLPAKLDWHLLEERCFQLFHEYGYDLQSGMWFCLISLRLKSWKGLALALELLSTAFTHNSQRCWPPVTAVQQRQQLIDWFNANVATHIYTLEYGPENSGEMRQVERSIGVLCSQSKNLQSRSHDSLNNLHYFLQVRCRSVPYPVPPKLAKILPVAEENTPQPVNEKKATQAVADMISAAEPPEIQLAPEPRPRPLLWASGGMAAGIAVCVVAVALWSSSQTLSLSEKLSLPLMALQHSERQLNDAWENAPASDLNAQKEAVLAHAAPVLSWISEQPADMLLRQGEILSDHLEKVYPDNEYSAQWRRTLQEKAGDIPALDGYVLAHKHLDELEARLLNAEKKHSQYMTVSELKTAVYQIRQDLQRNGTSAETLLWTIGQDKENHREVNPALLKQFTQRVDALNAYRFGVK
ncbi:VasL domain-containing protein [Rahnella perminowiae]|uniref:VasL domain-containing protein n=1 Tax=Rahnella perminowiae TaxID=2816244 RepID=UPI001C2561A9|nr:VasL domain-containing protein [Rahnella perminowiae]MBU9824245.1 type VI secretion system ImpA family N-terminal domain-containing protein [Rahnella perminowiae]